MEKETVTFSDFEKLDLRIGLVRDARAVERADRLIALTVDVGEDKPRTIVAGLRQYYQPEELIGKRIVVLLNLEPRRMRGVMSHGMLLAASTDNFETVRLLTTDAEIDPGSRIS